LPFVANGIDDAVGQVRYQDLMANKPASLAALLNITTALGQINLPQGTPLDYLKRILWDDSLAQDRFFAYCDPELLNQVRTAAAQVNSRPKLVPAFFIQAQRRAGNRFSSERQTFS